MSILIDNLVSRIELSVRGPRSDEELLRYAAADAPFSPWEVWTLLSLLRHGERQRWVAKIVHERLRGSGEELAVAGAFAHPETLPQQGVVPGMIEWEYYFHGSGCCITHRVTEEAIDVDFYDAEGCWIDTWFYVQYLKSLTAPEPFEKRLIELHPKVETVLLSIDSLKQCRLLEALADRSVWRPTPDTQRLEACLADFCEAWLDPRRHLQAVLGLGDWFSAEAQLSNRHDSLAEQVRSKAAACRDRRAKTLLAMVRQGNQGHVALQALAEMKAPQLRDALQMALQGPPSGAMNQALGILQSADDLAWCEDVWRLFDRLSPLRDIPEPAAWCNCATLLLKHSYRKRQVVERLRRAVNRETGEASILLLEYAPLYARDMFRLALRSTIPMERTLGAAALAVLDEPWCHQELIELLANETDQETTSDVRAALACSSNSDCHAVLLEWERRNPYVPEPGPYYTFADLSVRHSNEWLQHTMAQIHDRVLPLRGRVT